VHLFPSKAAKRESDGYSKEKETTYSSKIFPLYCQINSQNEGETITGSYSILSGIHISAAKVKRNNATTPGTRYSGVPYKGIK
jgi:hypothetical protein